ncbi:MAG: Co2+/Mg2+ efflux protein ApaG, partial [Methylobacteriaceae bacterium]|nr:Co2+/Mg2+ efflux protein ApaG [Methylobacteriaceae bacterium]
EVTVLPEFLPDRSEPSEGRFVWAYTIEITNHSDQAVQLKSRHWIITDARGHMEEVRGPGVVGEQPVLNPGDAFRYTSGCPLSTPSGIMSGTYRMAGADGRAFDIEIPAFSLDSPYAKRVLN